MGVAIPRAGEHRNDTAFHEAVLIRANEEHLLGFEIDADGKSERAGGRGYVRCERRVFGDRRDRVWPGRTRHYAHSAR